MTAYSVFTHLPDVLFRFWLGELLRVTAPGGLIVFTVEPERFLDFIAGVDPETTESLWHRNVRLELGDLEARRAELHKDGLSYIPSGGGPFRGPEVYGETVVTPDYIDRAAGDLGRRLAWLDDPDRFWQAVVAVQRQGDWWDRMARSVAHLLTGLGGGARASNARWRR